MNHTVFISHSVKEKDQEAANRIYDYLEHNGIKCFMDKRDLVPGKSFPEQLTEAIEKGRVLVLVFSVNSDVSDAVQNEVGIARNNRIPIIPVRIEDAMPRKLALFITTYQWLDAFPPPVESHLPRLVDAIKKHIGEQKGEIGSLESQLSGMKATQPPSTTRPVKSGSQFTDHMWHDIPYNELKDWVKKQKYKLEKGEEIVGKVFRYRLNWNTHQYQIRLRNQHKSARYRK
ncbi:MAG: toll/interleukin-1 receptor domain-containing protein [Chloroflexi bacterium]|nr:toll/interleukin-1 receptor domain-containing protein [Chloroflexota bacterium]